MNGQLKLSCDFLCEVLLCESVIILSVDEDVAKQTELERFRLSGFGLLHCGGGGGRAGRE